MLTNDELQSIDLIGLREHLQAAHWSRIRDVPAVYRSPAGKVVQIPADLGSDAAIVTLRVALEVLAREESLLSVNQLMTRLSAVEDFLCFGSEFPTMKPGQLPLGMAPAYYRGLERYVRRTVAAEADFRPTDAAVPRRAAEYLKKVNVGRVFEGSYMVTVHLPLESFSRRPLGRRVWQRVVRCLDSLEDATATDSEVPLLRLDDQGWTAPMCEALGELIQKTEPSELKAHVSPNPAFPGEPITGGTDAGVNVRKGTTVEVLGRAIFVLRGIPEERRETITGFLYSAEDKELAKQGDARVVKIRWEREDHDPVTVYAELDPDRYRSALEALRTKKPITVSGRLTRKGVLLYLTPETQLKLL